MAAGKQRATLAWISTEADSPRAVRLLRARRHLAELGIELRACWRLFHDEEIARARADGMPRPTRLEKKRMDASAPAR